MNISIEEKAKELAEAAQREENEVLVELRKLINEQGHSIPGAISRWKSDNKFQLGAGRSEMVLRLLAIEEPNIRDLDDGDTSMVSSFHFVTEDPHTGYAKFLQGNIWNENRIKQLMSELEIGEAYRVMASYKDQDTLTRISGFEPVEDADVPELTDIEPVPIEDVVNAIGKNELVRGWIGKKIGETGMEVSDLSAAPPLTVWFGGKWSKIPAERQAEIAAMPEDTEVVAYGYVSQKSNDIRMNAVNIVALV